MEARAAEAKARQKRRCCSISEKNIEFGPPDKVTNFNKPTSCKRKQEESSVVSVSGSHSKKRCIEIDDERIELVPDKHPGTTGKKSKDEVSH